MMEKLYQMALGVFAHAYAPYSRFQVAAALRTASDRIFVGCNVENLSFGATLCAERVAISSAITAGERQFKEILILTDTPRPVPPCGLCRQIISEFGSDILIHSTTINGGTADILTVSIEQLLPLSLPHDLLQRPSVHETLS
ncbi:MAG: cytidine deaminase [Spirochaetales bacterium]|nr:cytidine deaminase [Spirochaetales bacterium]